MNRSILPILLALAAILSFDLRTEAKEQETYGPYTALERNSERYLRRWKDEPNQCGSFHEHLNHGRSSMGKMERTNARDLQQSITNNWK